ncbi:MAG: helix-turn-helix domain-containing protein [Streptosporangiales bacterium]|nr:helix-turn-helix domain-containing protein [Streptosporangiales bacterium]
MAEARDVAWYWRHPGLPGVDLLRARFVRHRYGRHTHDGYAIGVIEAGVEEWHYRGSTHRAGPGGMVFVGPGEVHDGHAGVPEGWAYRMLYPPVDLVTDVAAELGRRNGTPRFPDDAVYDPASARAFRAAHRAAESGDVLATSSLTRIAIATLLRRHAVPRPMDPADSTRRLPAAVTAAREILHERLADPPSLHDLAAEVGTAPFVLLRAFRAATGLPPHTYLNQERVRRARALLDGGTPPAEVAARIGFADQAHLTRHFKRIVGVPPGAYRTARTFKTDGEAAS